MGHWLLKSRLFTNEKPLVVDSRLQLSKAIRLFLYDDLFIEFQISKAKKIMEASFEKNRVKPDDDGFEYDIEVCLLDRVLQVQDNS